MADTLQTAHPVVAKGVRGRVRQRDGGLVVVATEASYEPPHAGWGFVSTHGHWGFSGRVLDGREVAATDQSAVTAECELRAIDLALRDLKSNTPATFLIVGSDTLDYLHTWRSGRPDIMPIGYCAEPVEGESGTPVLMRLSGKVVERAHLDFVWQNKQQSGHPLSQGARELADIARQNLARQPATTEDQLKSWGARQAAKYIAKWRSQR